LQKNCFYSQEFTARPSDAKIAEQHVKTQAQKTPPRGTSLSKVFGRIERFSEDIDLILDWREITNEDPEAARSRTKQELFNNKLQTAAQNYISQRLLPKCQQLLSPVAKANLDPNDPHSIIVR
jgi:hypothetical protein